ncbi:MAG: hypothetical protein QG595_1928, partial [Pseudomonadota bacterium]|nr:hypothetical protein [Pseudomonadota bacterium]
MPLPEYAMRALRETQADFLAAVLGRDPAHAARWPYRGLAVYRTNARENFAAALEAAFPLLHGLMGHDEFRAMAWAFQRHSPPRSGNQFYCGAGLPGFLATHLADTPDAALAEVAKFEWLIQEVLVAADPAERFDFALLAAVPEAQHVTLRFGFHPAIRLQRARLPLFRLWQDHQQHGTVSRAALEPSAGHEQLLIRRTGEGVELQRLEPAEFRFLDALLRGETLELAVGQALADGGDSMDAGKALAAWISAGVITGLA